MDESIADSWLEGFRAGLHEETPVQLASGKAKLPARFGKYIVLAELGRGGMGVVFRARHEELARDVALKLLRASPELTSDESLARFRREAEVMARLTHPNIVAIHDSGIQDGLLYIVMDLIPGMTLDRFLTARFPPREQAISIIEQVARALQTAHDAGIVHRDVKPGNILVDESGKPFLTDFGLAKSKESSLTMSGEILGTPYYMSPEQASGSTPDVDARSDVYALGAILYHILTGFPPFTGTTVQAVLLKVAHQDPIPPRAVDPKVPRDLETICLKALQRDPSNRYANALATAEDLSRFRKGEPILARPTGMVGRIWKRIRRHRVAVATTASALLLAGVATSLAVYFSAQLRSQKRELEHGMKRGIEKGRDLTRTASEAQSLYLEGRYKEALPKLVALEGSELDSPQVRLRRAICLRELGNHAKAESEFQIYLKQHAGDTSAWRHRGLNAMASGDWPVAVQSYTRAARAGNIPASEFPLGEKDYDVLIATVERHFRQTEPQHARPYLASYNNEYEYDLTKQIYCRFKFPEKYGQPKDWFTRYPPTKLRWNKKNRSDMLKSSPNHPAVLGWISISLVLDRSPKALAVIDQTLAGVPQSRWMRYLRCVALIRTKQFQEADRELLTLQVLVPSARRIQAAIARSYAKVGEFRRAGQIYEAIVVGKIHPPSRSEWFRATWTKKAALMAAKDSRAEDALRLLRVADNMGKGVVRASWIRSEPDFKPYLELSAFRKFVDSLDP